MKELNRNSLLILAGACAFIAVFGLSKLWIHNIELWAGVGQWFGGFGALFAALVALYTSRQESLHRRDEENTRQQLNAYYVQVGYEEDRIRVKNTGSQPVLNVEIVALHDRNASSASPGTGDLYKPKVAKAVLLPGEEFVPSLTLDTNNAADAMFAILAKQNFSIEFQFDDLTGNRWRRLGEHPPKKIQ